MHNKLQRCLSVSLVPMFVTLIVTGCGQATANKKTDIVATYKGGSISQSELNMYLNVLTLIDPQVKTTTNSAKTQVLQQYIVLDRILAGEATKAGFKSTSATVQNNVSQFKSQIIQQYYNNSIQVFNQKMNSLHLSDSDVTRALSSELAVEQYAASLIPANAGTDYYHQHLASFTMTTQRGILVKTKTEAENIYRLLKIDHSTSDWNKLAKQYSQDPGSKDSGGLYSNQPAGNWVPQYAQAVTTQPIGQIGQPFDTTYGWFVVEVLDRHVEPLTQVQSLVVNRMLSDPTSPYSLAHLVDQTQKHAAIKITLPTSTSKAGS